MFSSKLNKINLPLLRNKLFSETQQNYSLYSILLRRHSNKKLSIHEKTLQLEKEIKKLEQKILKFDKKAIASESDSQPLLSEDLYTNVYKAISDPSVPLPRRLQSNFTNNLKLPMDSLQACQRSPFPSISDLKASKQDQANAITEWDKENLESLEQFNKWLYACALLKRPDEVLDIFLLMEKAGITPNIITYDNLINLFASVGDLQKAIESFELIEPGKPTIHSYANLIKAYVKYNRVDDAFNVYSNMKNSGVMPSQPIFTTLIKGCIDNGEIKRAWTTFDHMRLEVCQPDEVTYSLMIRACAKEENSERAFDLYQEMKEKGLYPTDVTFNSLIHACAKRKDIL